MRMLIVATVQYELPNMKAVLALLAVLCCTQAAFGINIVSKSEWGGVSAWSRTWLPPTVNYVVIHHSEGAYCNTKSTCSQQMRSMQSYHMNNLGWSDIGYNYGIGADGNIYEGRGLGVVGAHAYGWNAKSYGIMFIGNYFNYQPTATQVAKAHELMNWLVSKGELSANYVVYGHRQVDATDCPGTNLYNEIKRWSHWKA